MAYDELELDRIGDRKTAVFFIISDTTQTYNFLVALAFSQMFNLLCERADNVHGGRLPHHVRVLWDEAANTGQVPQLEKIVAVIRSREISLTLFYQQLAQCMIHSILTNPTYTGDLAQGRSRVKSYKVHEVESVPREEWVEVAGTHEAIIDYETFDKVQALLQRDTRTSPKGREVHLFSGFLKCADCGRAITRSVGNNNNVYYACSTYKNRSRTACTMHSIKHNRLEAAVLFAVQQQIHLAVSYSEMIARINTAPVKKSQSIRLEELIAAKERELAKISRYKQSLYQDWKDGEITQQDYRDMKTDYERQTIALTDVLARLNAERAELANGVKSEHPALVAFTKHQNIDQLSRELLVELIDHIKVYENGNISVRFKFADEFRRIAEYIEINTTKPAVAG